MSPDTVPADSVENDATQKKDTLEDMLNRVKEVFERYDRSGDGVLDMGEIRKALVGLQSFRSDTIDAVCVEVDKSKDGKVSYKEFIDWIRAGTDLADDVWRAIKRKTGDARTARIKATFERYDKSGDGSLDIEEMRAVLKTLGSFTNHEIAVVCADLDKSGDGEVDYQEFEDWIRRGACSKEIAKAKAILAPSDDDGLEGVFYKFCGAGHSDMDGKSFLKMCRDCKLLDKSLTETQIDLLFTSTKLKPKGQRTIDFPKFEIALNMVAEKKGVRKDRIRVVILESTGPVLVGTGAKANRFHDDPMKLNREGSVAIEPVVKKRSRPKVALAAPVPTRPVTQEEMRDVWRTFGIGSEAGRSLRRLYGGDEYVPEASSSGIGTFRSRWPPEPDTYVAVNALQTSSYGLHFRRSMKLNDLARGSHDYVPWGERVQGERIDALWLKVGDKYLPTSVNGARLLEKASSGPRCFSCTNDGMSRSASLPSLKKSVNFGGSDGILVGVPVGIPSFRERRTRRVLT